MLLVLAAGGALFGGRRLWIAYVDHRSGRGSVPTRVHVLQAVAFLSLAGLVLALEFDRTIAAAVFGIAIGVVGALLAIRFTLLWMNARRSGGRR